MKRLAFASLAAAAALLGSEFAWAQTPERGVSVQNRPRPDFDPLGVRAGAFILYPQLRLAQQYNSNIYATPTNRRGDFITVIAPGVRVDSDWNRHGVGLAASAEIGRHARQTRENYLDYSVAANGRLDIVRGAYLTGVLQHQRLHEERGAPTAEAAAAEPTVYRLNSARAFAHYGIAAFSASLGATALGYRYDNTPRIGGGTIDNRLRDRNVFEVAPRLAYEVVPGVSPFVETRFNWRRYRHDPRATTPGAVFRDSAGQRYNVGTSFDIGGITTGEVFAGYMRQNYEDPRLPDISGFGFGGSVLWNVTALTSVILTGSRTIEEAATPGASGYVATLGSVRVEHELLRNLLLNASAAYSRNDYRGGVNRRDNILQAGVGANYLMNRNLSAGPEYTFRQRDSNAPGADYTTHIFMLRVTGSL